MTQILFSDAPAKGWRPWGALVPFLGIAFVAFGDVVPASLLARAHLLDAHDNPVNLLGFAGLLFVCFGTIGLVILTWLRVVERRPWETIGLTRPLALRTFMGGHLIGIAMMALIVAGMWLAGAVVAGEAAPAFRSPAALAGIGVLLLGFAVQSSVEEIAFRGWMLSAIAAKFNVTTAVILSLAVFTLLHYEPHQAPVDTLNIVLFALFACSWALRTGNIWGVMGWHAGWNWFTGVGFRLPITGLDTHMPALVVKLTPVGPDILTGGATGPEGSIVCTLVLSAGIAFHLLRRRTAAPVAARAA